MNKKEAIKTLEQQRNKVLEDRSKRNTQWIFQTASYIKDFFGEYSVEYKWISQFKWSVSFISIDGEVPEKTKRQIKYKITAVTEFLDNSISTLNNKGIYKEKNQNWLSEMNNWKIMAILFGFIVFGFGVGYWVRDFEIIKSMTKVIS